MRNLVRQSLQRARRSEERIGVAKPAQLGTEAVRLARLATSIHLAASARLHNAGPADPLASSASAERELPR